jgi:FkbM family methyltransferase
MGIIKLLKRGVKQALLSSGWDLHRVRDSHLVTALQLFNIDLVVDVGANKGQFASDLRAHGYSGAMISIEPLADAHQMLFSAASKDPHWRVLDRCAVGAHEGEIEINVAGNSASSSVLPMLEACSNACPISSYIGKEIVPITTLDTIAAHYFGNAKKPFLKIDTQGYEWQVLDGATHTLPMICGIQMEVSLVPLYEGQRLWLECIHRLENEGFVLWSIEPVFVDPSSGRTLQFDAVFFRI